ncbi:MAG: hypothetical protein PHT57_15920 [Rhodoferax sp.]|nr:hypothetical protein [Rhodoferax sp.]
MTLHHSLPRSRRLAFALALLAVLAQLWMAQVSTRHIAHMLWQQSLWGDVCSAQHSLHTLSDPAPDSERTDPLPHLAHCPVCSAAASFAPGTHRPALVAAQALAPYRIPLESAPVRALHHANLRPPAQAPPRACA